MPAPTLSELHQFITDLVAERQGDDRFAVFEYEYLAQESWRHFRTTSPAIRSRMDQLIGEGSLRAVRISESGYVYLGDRDLEAGLFSLYFQYCQNRRYDPEHYGFVTASRPQGMRNVWRDGYRNLYTTGESHDAMVTHFREVKAARDDATAAKEAQETARLWEMLEAESPGARLVLSDLRRALRGGEIRSEVSARLVAKRREENGSEPWIKVDARGLAQSVKLIEIIRRGLEDRKEDA